MRLASITVFSTLLACALLHAPMASAWTFKWVDDEGKVHYGDSVPPEYSDKERKKMNEQGRTVQVYDAAKTPEQLAEEERLEALRQEQLKQAEARARKDNVLLATYSSEADLLKTRDSRLMSLEGLIQLTHRRIRSMNYRIKQLTEDAADYERSGKPVPEMLSRQIENIRTQTAENEAFIMAKMEEQDAIKEEFRKDIERFLDLKGQEEQ